MANEVLQSRGNVSDTLQWMGRDRPALFKGRHFEAEIIVLCVSLVPAVWALLPEPGGDDGRT